MNVVKIMWTCGAFLGPHAIRDHAPPACRSPQVMPTRHCAPGWQPLSCEYAFYHAQRRAGRSPNEGAFLSSILDALREDGQPDESGWPYLATTPADMAAWTPPADVGPIFCRNGEASIHSLENVIHELDQGRPVIVLLMLSQPFYAPSPLAVVDPAPGEMPEPARRHAVIAVGHATVETQRAVLIRNSWGPRWGDAGYGWLTERFLVPRIFAAATLLEEV